MRTPAPVSHASRGAAGLARLHEQFLGEQRFSARLSTSTLRGYRQTFALLVALMPTLDTQQLTPAAMTEFFRRLETRSRVIGRGQAEVVGVKTSTVATYRSKLNRFFGWLKAKREIAVSPFEGMPYPRVNST
jgi:site-specific recombinase XerC